MNEKMRTTKRRRKVLAGSPLHAKKEKERALRFAFFREKYRRARERAGPVCVRRVGSEGLRGVMYEPVVVFMRLRMNR